jgi:hypothetical protein
MKVYLIPGLGADKRMYTPQLGILNDAVVLEHQAPRKGETLSDYAQRLVPMIDTSAPFVLVGTSLGGMISMELMRHVNPVKVILIASIKDRSEMPLFMRAMRIVKLHRILTGKGFKRFNNFAARRLDSRGDALASGLILEMVNDASPEFVEWAINAVIHWRPPVEQRDNIIHLHGTNDRLFPFGKIRNATAIKNGSHVMNITMSEEVNKALLAILNELDK